MDITNPSPGEVQAVRPVVTAFVWDGQRVLVSQRSEDVSTFPDHWAGISGYLEGSDPAAWAVVEIEEETGLSREQLTLRGAGEVLEALDTSTGQRFVVHPLLFSVPPGTPVRPDWESQRLEWVSVEQMLQRRLQPAVPRLFEAFEAIWPPWNAERSIVADGMLTHRFLVEDRSLGAGELARVAGAEIMKLAEIFADEEFATLREALRRVIDDLAHVRPSMATPTNLMADMRNALEAAEDASDFRQWALGLLQRSRAAESRLAERVAARIHEQTRVMTLGYSNTVLQILIEAAPRLDNVVVCEGRPLCEGRQLAEKLVAAGVKVTLITEAQAVQRMLDVDLILLGADCVLPERGVINKIGSAGIALAAHQHGKPVWAVAENLKWVRQEDPNFSLVFEEGAPQEVWGDSPDEVSVLNVYFELVPQAWISELINEDSV